MCWLMSSSRSIGRSGLVSIELLVASSYEHERSRLLGSQIFMLFIFSLNVSRSLLVCGHEGLACGCVCSCGNKGGDGHNDSDGRDGLSLNRKCDLNLNGVDPHEEIVRDRVGCATT